MYSRNGNEIIPIVTCKHEPQNRKVVFFKCDEQETKLMKVPSRNNKSKVREFWVRKFDVLKHMKKSINVPRSIERFYIFFYPESAIIKVGDKDFLKWEEEKIDIARVEYFKKEVIKELMEKVWHPNNYERFKYLDPDMFDEDEW